MALVENVTKVLEALRLKRQPAPTVSVAVGYTQNYAIFVHENMEATHHVGQAKFLEEPLRTLAPALGTQVSADIGRGLTLGDALLRAGLRLQRESQKLVPVDTGALKNSAFTALDENLPAATRQAYESGEAKRAEAEKKRARQAAKRKGEAK
jgi:hypothetical protein